MNFYVKSNDVDGVRIVELVGKLTIGGPVREFRYAIDGQISQKAPFILINFSQLTFMDSSGIGELVGCNNKAREAGCRLVLCELPGKIRDLFRITQVSRLFTIYDSEAMALQGFGTEVGTPAGAPGN